MALLLLSLSLSVKIKMKYIQVKMKYIQFSLFQFNDIYTAPFTRELSCCFYRDEQGAR